MRHALLARVLAFRTACRAAGSLVDFGVDSSTGISGAGVPRIVTKIVAVVIDGFGDGETGGPTEGWRWSCRFGTPQLRARRRREEISRRLGMGGSLRRLRLEPRSSSPRAKMKVSL